MRNLISVNYFSLPNTFESLSKILEFNIASEHCCIKTLKSKSQCVHRNQSCVQYLTLCLMNAVEISIGFHASTASTLWRMECYRNCLK